MTPITFITGGSRSGKSTMARGKISPYPRKTFLATAEITDEEMARRIEKHQKERGDDFQTIEEPLHLVEAIRREAYQTDAILVDCLTFWLNNLFHHFGHDFINHEIEDFLKILDEKPVPLILVSNEINMGVVPPDSLSRCFVDQQGWLNQEVARRADEVIFMVSGIPQWLKGAPLFTR